MTENRREFSDAEVSGGDAIRGDAPPVEGNEDLDAQEAIRARAHDLYLQRGEGVDGSEVNDWLEAEREYRERRGESEAREQPDV